MSQGSPEKSNLPAEIKPRYLPTKWKYKVGLTVTIFSLTGRASFGIVVAFPVVGRIDVRVVGEITGKIELKGFEAEFAKDEDTAITVGPSGKAVGRLYATAALETCVYTWKKEIGIEAGIAVDVLMKWTAKQTDYSLSVYTLPVQWYFTAVNSRTGVSDTKMHVLFEKRPLLEAKGSHAASKP
jgi:hypothetical protein